jgi:Fe-S-cluster-containing dehydrogenase component/DMSO reductase anchor subunit
MSTAVEAFAELHEEGEVEGPWYRSLLPLDKPRAGQQYAFEVDLDSCSGCKACVTGCHSMNGLDEGEIWRSVGLLHGGSALQPVARTVTSSCHHCVEPACMQGCPVAAYEKDPLTGIVKHLDDQCIGCQYCLFMCPYDAPKFNASLGIVRKCDLCSDRLAHDEPPACAQACPNKAIRVTVVEQSHAIEAAQASSFLPGAPAPDLTIPTTVYRSARELPHNLLPADFYSVNPESSHPPLVAMLVLTQLSVGAFAVELFTHGLGAVGTWVALALGLAAMGASILHLGRPQYAFRALLGLGTSWLSREILAFSVFAFAAALYAGSRLFAVDDWLRLQLLRATAASGVVGVFASVMVYAATRRPAWRAPHVALRFFGAAALLGCATVLALAALGARDVPALARALVAVATIKLAIEASIFRHLRSRRQTAQKRMAILMSRPLRTQTRWRFACGIVGGVLLPALLLLLAPAPTARAILAVAGLACVLAGELLERHLFFVTATALKMPGGPA